MFSAQSLHQLMYTMAEECGIKAIFLGPPACGKGTQVHGFCAEFRIHNLTLFWKFWCCNLTFKEQICDIMFFLFLGSKIGGKILCLSFVYRFVKYLSFKKYLGKEISCLCCVFPLRSCMIVWCFFVQVFYRKVNAIYFNYWFGLTVCRIVNHETDFVWRETVCR